jgi:hypothetical protein
VRFGDCPVIKTSRSPSQAQSVKNIPCDIPNTSIKVDVTALAPETTAVFFFCGLVPPICFLSFPDDPLDVASTAGLTVAVLCNLVTMVVPNVKVDGVASCNAPEVIKTSANPGAGT